MILTIIKTNLPTGIQNRENNHFMKSLDRLCLLAALLFSSFAYSQTTVQGKIFDDQNQALSFANVLLLNVSDSTLVKGNVTDENGLYKIENVPSGNYFLSASMIGYRTVDSKSFEIRGNEGNKNLETLTLSEDVAELNEIQVTAKKPLFEQKIDRLVVNVENSITSAGSSALEVLERSPGVIVNRQNNTLSLAGKSGVVVMINDKINYMPIDAVVQMLAGMSADNIVKIELITTPPANFDAEGDAGYINIVLKENTNQGLNGNFSLSGGYGRGEVSSASVNFNYRNQKVNLFGSYSFLREHQEQYFNNYRKIVFEGVTTENFTETDRDPTQLNHNLRLGADFQISDKTVIGALVSAYDNKWSMYAENDSEIKKNGVVDTTVFLTNDEVNQWRHFGANLNLQHNFTDNDRLSFDLDYLYYHDNNPNDYLNTYSDGLGNFLFEEETFSGKKTPIEILVGKADYSKKIGDGLKFETGLKATMSKFTNDVIVQMFQNNDWVTDPSLTAKYSLTEDIAAAYAALDIKLDEKSSVKAGLRYEFTDSNLGTREEENIVDREYGQWFPSLFLTRQFNDNHSANLSYSRRINRPTFNDMAPFVIFLDPNTFFAGNSALQPSVANSIKADYRFKTTIISVQYTFEDNAIARFQDRVIAESNKQIVESVNMKNRETFSLTLALPWYVSDWWEMQNNLIGLNTKSESVYQGDEVEISVNNFQIYSAQTFKLPKKFSAELSGYYQSPTVWGLAKSEPIWQVNVGVQKQFEGDQGTLRFNVEDVFNSMKWDAGFNYPEQNLVTRGVYDFSQTTFKVTYSRSFGNKKLKAARNRATGSEEERRRVN